MNIGIDVADNILHIVLARRVNSKKENSGFNLWYYDLLEFLNS